MGPSKVLVIGGTGELGQHIVNASVNAGHPTFALVRSPTPSDPAKAKLLKSFRNAGVTLLVGDLDEHASLVAALRQVEVVISAVSGAPTASQVNILAAAKEAGTIKRFLPSEFGFDHDRLVMDVPLTTPAFETKLAVRRAIRESGIPYTFVVGFAVGSHFVALSLQAMMGKPAPRDGKLLVFGGGNVKGAFLTDKDAGTFIVSSVDDPRAANKTLHVRPKENTVSQNDFIALWEKKIGHVFEKEFLSKEETLKSISELPPPMNFYRALSYHMCVPENSSSELDPSKEVEASALYPEVKYTTVDEYVDRLALPNSVV